MRWKRLGHIFDPADYALPDGCRTFAQSPQALVLADRVRIYFSTRSVDPVNGKFISHVSFVDMDKRLESVLGVAQKTVMPPGALGAFDEHGIFPFSPFVDDGKICAYTCGWSRRQSVSVETSTGFATSMDDGLTFTRNGAGPVMGASLHEPFLVGDAFVRKYGGRYHMWYMKGVRWVRENDAAAPDRVYKIAHATSADGQHWVPDGDTPVADILHANECQALPTVICLDGVYHMYFCFRDVFGFRTDPARAYRLGYATSTDLENWRRDDAQGGMAPSLQGWDSGMMCYPHLFSVEGRVYLLYNGNEFGRSGFGAALLEGIK